MFVACLQLILTLEAQIDLQFVSADCKICWKTFTNMHSMHKMMDILSIHYDL